MEFLNSIDKELNELVKKYGNDKLENTSNYSYLCGILADYENELYFKNVENIETLKSQIIAELDKLKKELSEAR